MGNTTILSIDADGNPTGIVSDEQLEVLLHIALKKIRERNNWSHDIAPPAPAGSEDLTREETIILLQAANIIMKGINKTLQDMNSEH